MNTARPTLEAWINEEQLVDERLATYRSRFELHPLQLLVIDNVLCEQTASGPSATLLYNSEYQSTIAICRSPHPYVEIGKPHSTERHCDLDRDTWDATCDELRFYLYGIIKGARPACHFSTGNISYLRLVISDFKSDTEHKVAPVSVDAGQKARVSIGDWVLQRTAAPKKEWDARFPELSLRLWSNTNVAGRTQ